MKKTFRLNRTSEDVALKLLKEKFYIIKEVGSGLSGQVFLIEDQAKQLALKLLKPTQMNISPKEALENFKREFSILKELNHPNIAKIVDFDHVGLGEDNQCKRYYFTSEFIEGVDLAKACHNQPLEVKEKLFIQVLRALNYLHSKDIYHFDIKPQNILVEMKNGVPTQAKLVDFGLASFEEKENYRVGTPHYMAPEVPKGERLNSGTDIYSLGVTFYKILTGINPFEGKTTKETCDLQRNFIPKPASEINPEIPEYWSYVIQGMLEKKREHPDHPRYEQSFQILTHLKYLSGKEDLEIETEDTKLSYIPEQGELIAREKEWSIFIKFFENTFPEHSPPDEKKLKQKLLIVEGEKGTGKTRFLTEIKHYTQLRSIPIYYYKSDFIFKDLPERFVLFIDKEELSFNEVNTILQKILEKEKSFLLIWTAPFFKQEVTLETKKICLENFTKEELKQYLNIVLKPEKTPQYIVDEVFSRTQGNPFFVTEFTKSLIKKNILFDSSGKRNSFRDIKIDFNEILAPRSMEEILEKQYKETTEEEKRILNLFAIHGNELTKEKIEEILNLKNHFIFLSQLIEKHLLKRSSNHTYYFDNISLKEVVLNLLSKEETVKWHDLLSEYFLKTNERLPYLFHKGRGSDLEKSKKSLLELGKIQMENCDYTQASHTLEFYLQKENFSHDTNLYFKAHMNLCKCYKLKREFEKSINLHESFLKKLEKDEASYYKELFQLHQDLIDLKIKQSQSEKEKCDFDLQDAEKECQKTLNLTNSYKLPTWCELLIESYSAYIKLFQNQEEQALKECKRIYIKWSTLPKPEKLKVLNNRIIDALFQKERYEEAIPYCKERIKLLTGTKYHLELASALCALGDICLKILEQKSLNVEEKEKLIKQCKSCFEECEKIAREGNHYDYLQRALHGLGNLFHFCKKKNESIDYYERALDIHRKTGELVTAALTAYNISNAIHENRNYNDRKSFSYIHNAINIFQNLPHKTEKQEYYLGFFYISLCDHYIEKENVTHAEKYLELANQIFKKNKLMKNSNYWYRMRQAMNYLIQCQWERWDNWKQEAQNQIQTSIEQEDYHECCNREIVKRFLTLRGGDRITTQSELKSRPQKISDQESLEETIIDTRWQLDSKI